MTKNQTQLSRGSQWHRWDPHIHTPNTAKNNQFPQDSWDEYLQEIENASPKIKALGVTDYYLLENYKKIVEFKKEGRLPDVDFIFPNVEMRLDWNPKRQFINIHLLVNPKADNHLGELERFLGNLKFNEGEELFGCTKDELIRLGYKTGQNIRDSAGALKEGLEQYKISLDKLEDSYKHSDWAKENILIAISGNSNDGISGFQDSPDKTLRKRLGVLSHIMFTSCPSDREYWLGNSDKASKKEIIKKYNSLKPCLHGSDAHQLDKVGVPDKRRLCWIKGGLDFDTLKQARIDPERAYIGETVPSQAILSQVISEIRIEGAGRWMKTPTIPLNSGLVAIIGARGSGKTALADLIAKGCDAIPNSDLRNKGGNNSSFIARARDLLGSAEANVEWADGEKFTRTVCNEMDDSAHPRVRYLTQQFVEQLCSSHGQSDDLKKEIERVIFDALPSDEQDGCSEFSELLNLRVSSLHLKRRQAENNIAQFSEQISTEKAKEAKLDILKKQVKNKEETIKRLISEREKLHSSVSKAEAKLYEDITKAVQTVTSKLNKASLGKQDLKKLESAVEDHENVQARQQLFHTQQIYSNIGMTDQEWEDFLLVYKGNVEVLIKEKTVQIESEIKKIKHADAEKQAEIDVSTMQGEELNALSLEQLQAEKKRLEELISTDEQKRNQHKRLSDEIAKEQTNLKFYKIQCEDAHESANRIKSLQKERNNQYGHVFETIVKEEEILRDLYRPLEEKLVGGSQTLKKLSFSVSRIVDMKNWADVGEEHILDLRKSGTFRGQGALLKIANEKLKRAWEEKSPNDVKLAVKEFLKNHLDDIFQHSPVPREESNDYQDWMKKLAKWLFSTDHISIQYEIKFDGTDIRRLSPGLRGIVLLLLYLALDDKDTRPLIVDQPEENLDPKSVYSELVKLFIEVKNRRQVIIVTHNANLVVNTDADQIIVAEAGAHKPNALPPITYFSGGLESKEIRKKVCDILEGGETALKERAKRLRIKLDR